jgi:hypothetical protein
MRANKQAILMRVTDDGFMECVPAFLLPIGYFKSSNPSVVSEMQSTRAQRFRRSL